MNVRGKRCTACLSTLTFNNLDVGQNVANHNQDCCPICMANHSHHQHTHTYAATGAAVVFIPSFSNTSARVARNFFFCSATTVHVAFEELLEATLLWEELETKVFTLPTPSIELGTAPVVAASLLELRAGGVGVTVTKEPDMFIAAGVVAFAVAAADATDGSSTSFCHFLAASDTAPSNSAPQKPSTRRESRLYSRSSDRDSSKPLAKAKHSCESYPTSWLLLHTDCMYSDTFMGSPAAP
mmetsp:Transcript_12164/g.22389  ORF Transcript_12164/g.22389 Transcript_12164/m.22389 type:complete len:240 (-) Transcript_12164:282-1001(-)